MSPSPVRASTVALPDDGTARSDDRHRAPDVATLAAMAGAAGAAGVAHRQRVPRPLGVIASVAAAPPRQPAVNEATVIACRGEQLHLLPERAVHWPVRRTLFVADVHLGKEHVFGRQGIAIPGGSSEASLARLATLVAATGVERLVVLGDLMHAPPERGIDGRDEDWLDRLRNFLATHRALDVHVCAGNHDRDAGQRAVDAAVDGTSNRLLWHAEPIVDGPFVLQHHPGDDARGYVLSGHVHPAFALGGPRRGGSGDRLRVPAFWFRPGHAVLPAFGGFTGGHAIRPERGDRLWVSGPERVVAVSTRGR